jgi:hypothetical protein
MPMDGDGMHRWLGVRSFTSALVAADAGFITLWIEGTLETLAVVGGHVGCVVLLFGFLFPFARARREDIVAAAGFGLLVGPIAGPGLLVIEMCSVLGRKAGRCASDEISKPRTLAERVIAQIDQGRRHPGAGAVAVPFARVFQEGTLAEQHAAIAAISRRYHARMLPALKLALASEVPATRVQAAAVYAKLRGAFGASAKSLLEKGWSETDAQEMRQGADEARRAADSGFVDPVRAAELRALAATLDRMKDGGGGRATAAHAPPQEAMPRPRPPRLGRYACGGMA